MDVLLYDDWGMGIPLLLLFIAPMPGGMPNIFCCGPALLPIYPPPYMDCPGGIDC
jgi:hypothetical protein